MNLYAGTPYWLVKNPLWDYYHPLRTNIRVQAAIIGSGITGALMAHELLGAGIECCVVDKRTPATGSSCASTALLQYEIDVPLCRMADQMPEKEAVAAFRSCLDAIDDLERLFLQSKVDASFRRVPSVYYASNRKGLQLIREECKIRQKHGLPVKYLSRKELKQALGFEAPGALLNDASAEIDTYKAATGLWCHHLQHDGLPLYSHTEITEWKRCPDGYVLTTRKGHRIHCDYAVVAAGFEASPFLPDKLMQLTSTFAIVSHPVDANALWPGGSLIWETREPYLYIRTDANNRIIVGGEDIVSDRAPLRQSLLSGKAAVLEKKFRKLYPHIPFTTELAWAGTFSSTKDGLPLIGTTRDNPRMFYALGYGGNGITFSMLAAQIAARTLRGETDPRAHIFSLERPSLH